MPAKRIRIYGFLNGIEPPHPDGAAGDGGTLAQRLLALALRLGLCCDANEFVVALGKGREIEAVGFDDAAIGAAAAQQF